ncbi:MAG: hypothetical protein J7M25_16380 [Deltaproteobacteria bacterium]|nr:hypothetical protein [Deltaproteobacteria bacterium]
MQNASTSRRNLPRNLLHPCGTAGRPLRSKPNRLRAGVTLLVLTTIGLTVTFGLTGRAQAAEYWVQVLVTDRSEQAVSAAKAIQPQWPQGGRLTQVLLRRQAGQPPRYEVLVGVYQDLARAVCASARMQRNQPWKDKGFLVDAAPICLSGGPFVIVPVRFTEALAKACRANESSGRNDQGVADEGGDGRRFPMVAEALVAYGAGFVQPGPTLPPLRQSITHVQAWDRALVFDERQVCFTRPTIRGGLPPRSLGRPMIVQVHQGGKACLNWYLALTERDMKLAWFPANDLGLSATFKKAAMVTRWGPITYRYGLNLVGRSPSGRVYQAVFRAGAFPPVRMTEVIADRFSPPVRLGFDRMGPALFERHGLMIRRLNVHPPTPPVPKEWKIPKNLSRRVRYEPPATQVGRQSRGMEPHGLEAPPRRHSATRHLPGRNQEQGNGPAQGQRGTWASSLVPAIHRPKGRLRRRSSARTTNRQQNQSSRR